MLDTTRHGDGAVRSLDAYREADDEDVVAGLLTDDRGTNATCPEDIGRTRDGLSLSGRDASSAIDVMGVSGCNGAEASPLSLRRSSSLCSEVTWDTDHWDSDFEMNGTLRVIAGVEHRASAQPDKDHLSDPFAFGFLEDDLDFIHNDDRDRESEACAALEADLVALTASHSDAAAAAANRLVALLAEASAPFALPCKLSISDAGAVSLLTALRSPGRARDVLCVMNALILATRGRAADALCGLGLASVLGTLPYKGSSVPLGASIGALAKVLAMTASDTAVCALVAGGGLDVAVDLLFDIGGVLCPTNLDGSHGRREAARGGVALLLRCLGGKTAAARSATAGPSRAALVRLLALIDAPVRLAASLEAGIASGDTRLADGSARALGALCDGDGAVKERAARAFQRITPDIILGKTAFHEDQSTARQAHSDRLGVVLLKALKAVTMGSATALDTLASCGAIETVIHVLRVTRSWREGPTRDEFEDQLVPTVYYLCRIDKMRLARAARHGVATLLAACVARRRHLKQFALAVLCELCHCAATDNSCGN
mmetsp:Transcript_12500/g.42567  ORF Transcript_12500/g.42567 Transcript_12500/m.42567 type:complete len:546 (-) Transcript_12500:881-2518(-)